MGVVKIGSPLGHSDHESAEFSVLEEVGWGLSRTASLDFWRVDFGLFRRLVSESLGRQP